MESGISELPQGTIDTEDQATSFVDALTQDMLKWRAACNVVIPDDKNRTVVAQQRAMWVFLQKQGQVEGALQALFLTRKISERCYRELHQKAINSLIPTLVGQN